MRTVEHSRIIVTEKTTKPELTTKCQTQSIHGNLETSFAPLSTFAIVNTSSLSPYATS